MSTDLLEVKATGEQIKRPITMKKMKHLGK